MVSGADPAVSRRDFAAGVTTTYAWMAGKELAWRAVHSDKPRQQPARRTMDERDEPQHDRRLQAVPHDRRRGNPLLAVRLRLPIPLRRLLQLVDLGFPRRPRIQRRARSSDHGRSEPAVRAGHHLPRGEPLLNTGVLLPLSRKIRERFGRTKDIWCWTGLHVGGAHARRRKPRQA